MIISLLYYFNAYYAVAELVLVVIELLKDELVLIFTRAPTLTITTTESPDSNGNGGVSSSSGCSDSSKASTTAGAVVAIIVMVVNVILKQQMMDYHLIVAHYGASYIVILCLVLPLIIVGLCTIHWKYVKINVVPTKIPSDMPIKNDNNEDSFFGKIDLQPSSAPRMATNQSVFSTIPSTSGINQVLTIKQV